jgi:hypothetical protein
VSPEVAGIAARGGVRWLASDEQVLFRSLDDGARNNLYRPWRLRTESGDVAFVFRDRELSDRVGFVYQHVPAAEAVADFMERLRGIARAHAGGDGRPPVVAVILDGENCWEHYPEDGGPFLDALYGALENAPDIRTRTVSDVIDGAGGAHEREGRLEMPGIAELPRLHSGSWIDADFHIWMGHPEKNRGWELLARTRKLVTEAGATPASHPRAWEALHAAEGSDWFWWLGEDHPTLDKAVFDRIFRAHMQAACERAELPAPAWLHEPIIRVTGENGRRAPTGLVRAVVDGRVTHFYEWHAAGRCDLGAGGGSMHHGPGLASALHYGFDEQRLFLRLDFHAGPPGADVDLLMDVHEPHEAGIRVRSLSSGPCEVVWDRSNRYASGGAVEGASAVMGSVLELALPLRSLGLEAGKGAVIVLRLARAGVTLESLPPGEALRLEAPDGSVETEMWSV